MVDDPNNINKKVCKFELVKNHVTYHKYDIFGISETWLDESISDNDIKISGFHNPFRRDYNRNQRGILVYVSKNTPAFRRKDLEPKDGEIICIELQLQSKKVLICNCYRVQYYDIITFCADIDSIIDTASVDFDDIIFMGDMNARNQAFWHQDKTNTEGRALQLTLQALDFDQMIHEPTRIVGNSQSCIDLIFTNNAYCFNEVGTHPKIADICDHSPIYANLRYTVKKPKCYTRYVWDYKRGDYDKFRQTLLNAPWNDCYSTNNVDATVRNWMELFIECAESCIPHYKATIRPGDKAFMNSDIRKAMRIRDKLHREYKTTKDETIGLKYRKQ